jgi:hypothetical protein
MWKNKVLDVVIPDVLLNKTQQQGLLEAYELAKSKGMKLIITVIK